MAAYAALVSLSRTISQILNHDHDQSSSSLHEIQQIKTLCDQATSLGMLLENFPEKAASLEGRMRDVATEAEHVIEYFMLDQNRPIEPDAEFRLYCDFRKLYLELHRVLVEIDSLLVEVTAIENTVKVDDVLLTDSSPAASSSFVRSRGNDAMVGFEEDLAAIKYHLCGDQSSKFEVIPILGMGGIGKTTLARNAYDDPLCVEYFDIRGWVTVSQAYTVGEIFSNLLLSMGVSDGTLVIESVYKRLKGRRYLIVVDDMWSTMAWDDVQMAFPKDGNGSRIILTTRLFVVATHLTKSSISPYKMQLLEEDQSWKLLKEKVFREKPCPSELEHIGRTIARDCGGLPLTIFPWSEDSYQP